MLSSFRVVIQNAAAAPCSIRQPLPIKRCYFSSFSWSGPRALNDILKKELLIGKSREEISDIWLKYHQEKVRFETQKDTLHAAQTINVSYLTGPIM